MASDKPGALQLVLGIRIHVVLVAIKALAVLLGPACILVLLSGLRRLLLPILRRLAALELRQGLKIACLEEVALNLGYIEIGQVAALAKPIASTEYGRYLLQLSQRHDGQT